MNTRRRATTILPSCWTATPHRDEQAEPCSSHSAQRPRGGADGVNPRWREEKRDAKDHTIPVVRRQGRGGDEFLCLGLQEFKGCARVSLRSSGPGPKGTVMSATFQLDGQDFFALNGGPQFTFSPAISFFVNCETQEEVDELWEKLSAGGEK